MPKVDGSENNTSISWVSKTPNKQDLKKLQSFIKICLISSKKIKGANLTKIDFFKGVINPISFWHWKEIGLRFPIPMNIWEFGMFPIDLSRIIYDDASIKDNGKNEIFIPSEIEDDVYPECKMQLGKDNVSRLENLIQKQSIQLGKDFDSFININPDSRERIKLASIQLENWIIKRADYTNNWVFNNNWVSSLEKKTIQTTLGMTNYLGISVSSSREYTVYDTAKNICRKLLNDLINDKVDINKYDTGYQYKISSYYNKKEPNIDGDYVCYVGQLRKTLFSDAIYTKKITDEIKLNSCNMHSDKYIQMGILIGRIQILSDVKTIYPLGILKLQ